jgi:hypothetical protein
MRHAARPLTTLALLSSWLAGTSYGAGGQFSTAPKEVEPLWAQASEIQPIVQVVRIRRIEQHPGPSRRAVGTPVAVRARPGEGERQALGGCSCRSELRSNVRLDHAARSWPVVGSYIVAHRVDLWIDPKGNSGDGHSL